MNADVKWTRDEDEFLLFYHICLGPDGTGADFVASHDLGKPDGEGSKRLNELTQSGERAEFARLQLDELKSQVKIWKKELKECAQSSS